jgi:RND family efflux transporter MFP subunit
MAYERTPLYAKVPGYIMKLNVDKGDVVKKGQILIEVSSPEMGPELALAKAKLGAANANLAQSQANVEVETVTHHRLASLHATEPGGVTEEDVDVSAAKEKIARAEAEAVRAQIKVAEAEVQRLRDLMDYLQIPAPFDGIITQRFVDTGAFVTPAAGAAKPMLEISSVGKLRLTFEIPERLVPFVKQGHPISYSTLALPGKTFEGVVARRTESLSEDSHTMHAEVDVENSGTQFSPGMYGEVQASLEHIPGVSMLPATSVRTMDGKSCVLVVEGGTTKKHPVEVLVDDGPDIVVSGELKPESLVVCGGPDSLREGQRVECDNPVPGHP